MPNDMALTGYSNEQVSHPMPITITGSIARTPEPGKKLLYLT
jgi:hypothetical protein